MWFALTGKTAFDGGSMEQIHRAQQFSVLPIRELKSARVPSRLKLLLKSMLAFEPAMRPGVHKLVAELRSCAAQATGVRRSRVVLAAAATLILVASASFVFHSPRRNSASSSRLNPAPREQSIEPLPFENLSPEPDGAFWTHEAHANVSTKLAEIADLKTITRASAIIARADTTPAPFVKLNETVLPAVEQYRASRQIEKAQHRRKRVVYKRRLWDKLVYGWFSYPYHGKKK
jgi:hypothetical protein